NGNFAYQEIDCPAAQQPDCGGDSEKGDEKDCRQLECALAFPLAAQITHQEPQPIAPGEEIVLQDLITGHKHHPVGLLRAGQDQAIRGVTFHIQTVQGKLDVGRFGLEQQFLRLNDDPSAYLALAKRGMKGVAGIGWHWSFQGAWISSKAVLGCQNSCLPQTTS